MNPWRRGLVGGLIGGSFYLAVTIGIGVVAAVPTLPDVLGERLIALTPGQLFSYALDTLRFLAKPLFYLALVIALLVASSITSAWWLQRFGARGSNHTLNIVSLSGLLFAGASIIIALPGSSGVQPASLPAVLALQLAGFLAFGLGLWMSCRAFDTPKGTGGRRPFLRMTVLSVLGIAGGGGLLQSLALVRGAGALAQPSPGSINGLPPEITPTANFYSISKNFFDPVLDRSIWQLTVSGHLERQRSFTEADLRSMRQTNMIATLLCISNEIGGDLISNGHWRGVRLGDLLSDLVVQPGAVKVLFSCADGYTETLPIAKAMEPSTLLALDMNGEPLTMKHGAPLRLVVPNLLGLKNPKWITGIEVVTTDVKGYWQKQGYTDTALVPTMSRIDFPNVLSRVPHGPIQVRGIAFAGMGGISKVEVSIDGGTTWQATTLKEPLSPYSWTFWSTTVLAREPGFLRMVVRAFDGAGVPQVETHTKPYPNGATGLHRFTTEII